MIVTPELLELADVREWAAKALADMYGSLERIAFCGSDEVHAKAQADLARDTIDQVMDEAP